MNRRTLLSRLAKLQSSNNDRPDYFRTMHEPLEERMLLSVVNWAIDPALSSYTVAVPDQTFTIAVNSSTTTPVTFHQGNQNQTNDSSIAWTVGNAAAISGTLATDYVDGSSIQFLTGQSNALGVVNPTTNFYPDAGTATANPGFGDPNSGTQFYPNLFSNYIYDGGNRSFDDGKADPATNHTSPTNGYQSFSTTQGVFAWRLHAILLGGLVSADVYYFNATSMKYDQASGVLPISGGNFDATQTFLTSTSADLTHLTGGYGLNPPLAGQQTDYWRPNEGFESVGGTNASTTGTVTTPDPIGHPLVRVLTLPETGAIIFPVGTFTFTGTITGQMVATATLSPESVDLNGTGTAGTGFTSLWNQGGGPVHITDQTNAAVLAGDGGNLSSMTVALPSPHSGDALAVPSGNGLISGTSITASGSGTSTLTLSGSDTDADYQQVLRTVTYDNTLSGPGVASETANIQGHSSLSSSLDSNTAVATINIHVANSISVVNRMLFYKGSSRFDGVGGPREPLLFSDDNAIATDKSAYLPGSGATTFANVSSYTLGVNGLMVDVTGTHGTIVPGDFTFKTGNNNSPSSWTTVVASATVTTRLAGSLGLAPGGPDRIEITFPDNAIQKTWLEVIFKGNDTLGGSDTNTGLAASNVWFWGNALADDGTTPDDASAYRTATTDELDARNNPKTLIANIPISNAQDYNRDGLVSTIDQLASRNNPTTNISGPHILNIGGGGPFAPDAGASAAPAASPGGGGAALASGVSLLSNLPPSLPPWLQGRLQNVLDSAPVVRILHGLEHQNTAAARHILQTIDAIADRYNLNDDVLDGILVDLGLEPPVV